VSLQELKAKDSKHTSAAIIAQLIIRDKTAPSFHAYKSQVRGGGE
jgi:hypothetical protein